jgi:hypothetical protein
MKEVNMTEKKSKSAASVKGDLEQMYIAEYLRKKGYSTRNLNTLAEEEAARLRRGASRYASLKLAELESRARLRTKIHNVTESQ